MKKTYLLLLPFLFHLQNVSAQVLAGDATGLEYQAVNIDMLLTDPGMSVMNLYDSLDVDGDNIADLEFAITLANVPDFGGGISQVRSLNPSVELLVDTFEYELIQLLQGEPLEPDSAWTAEQTWDFASNFAGIGGPVVRGEWLNNPTGYMAFRIVDPNPNNNRYGWITVFTEVDPTTSVELQITEWAVQPVLNRLSDIKTPEELALFPNPTQGIIYLGPTELSDLQLFTSDGRLIRQFETSTSGHLDIADLPAGLYILKAVAKDKGPVQARILKN
jgi:hypothetical protein